VHRAGTGVLALDDDFAGIESNQAAGDRVVRVVGRRDEHLIAGRETLVTSNSVGA